METETGSQLVKFNITEAAIASLTERFANPVVPTDKAEYDILKARIKEVRDVRVAVDKERKAQTAAALEHQREVNKIGHGIINRLKDIEEPMKLCKAEVDEAAERKVREAEEAEEKRLQGINERLAKIVEYGTVSINDTVEDVEQRLARVKELDPTQGFDEFAKTAAEYQAKALLNLTQGADVLKAQANLAVRTKEIEEREAKANADQAERDAEETKRKAEEQAEEQKRLRQLEDEQADRDMKAAAVDDERRRLEQAPDKEKLRVYAQGLREVQAPILESSVGIAAIAKVLEWIHTLISDIESEADRL